MNGQDSTAEIFDVFLCHNSEDKPAVREISKRLAREGIKAWLDEEQIRPGTSWQTALGQQIESIKSAAVFVGESGFGPWQNQEIQALLSQFVERGCPVIPVILPSAKTTPDMPWTLRNIHYVDFRRTELDPLKQLIWGITGQKPATKNSLIPSREDDAASQKLVSEGRLYPSLAEPPDQEQVTQLAILRRRVTEYWVDGVLKHSLYNEVLISLGKREIGDAVDAPWKYTVEVSDTMNSSLEHRDVRAIYDATGLLLILGEPGSGKTTTLLDVAATLLDRARDDIKERVPIILNLSNWKKKQRLAEWMSGELSEKYRVPKKVARYWLKQNYLLPLLDGLDEIETVTQPDCVAAINEFIEDSNPSGLVVCCRLNEYQWLPKRLKLNGAICIEPLSSEEVSKYLDRGGPKLSAFREAVNADPVLQELAETPLMLSVMSLAFQGASNNELHSQKGDSLEERRRQVFRLYVEQIFQWKGAASLVFPKEKVIRWLSWLAGKMREHSQSVFIVEGFQPSWLATRAQRVAYGTVVALSVGLICGLGGGLSDALIVGPSGELSDVAAGLGGELSDALIVGLGVGLSILVGVLLGCWSKSPLQNGGISGSIGGLTVGLIAGLSDWPGDWLATGLIGGLIAALIAALTGGLGVGSLSHITLVETMSWEWNRFSKRTISGFFFGVIVGSILVVIGGRGTWVSAELRIGLSFGLIFGLLTGFIGGFTDRVKVGKASPNEGIKLSWKNFLAVFLVTWLAVGLIVGLIARLTVWGGGVIVGLIAGPTVGLGAGLIVGLNRGGSAVMKHYALRLILWLKGYTPFNFIKFLDYCAKLIFLKKVGGGYIFIHRMLLDYFADLPTQAASNKSASDRSEPG